MNTQTHQKNIVPAPSPTRADQAARFALALSACALVLVPAAGRADLLNLANSPLFLSTSVPSNTFFLNDDSAGMDWALATPDTDGVMIRREAAPITTPIPRPASRSAPTHRRKTTPGTPTARRKAGSCRRRSMSSTPWRPQPRRMARLEQELQQALLRPRDKVSAVEGRECQRRGLRQRRGQRRALQSVPAGQP